MTLSLSRALTVLEKGRYPFGAYPAVPCRSVLFPGCGLTSQFPRTTDALAALCRRMGMGVAFDCCAAPVAALGEDRLADRALGRLDRRLAGLGCDELVLACPTCYAHLAGRLGVRCVSVYEKLLEWAAGPAADRFAALVFGGHPKSAGGLAAMPAAKPVAKSATRPVGVLFTPCPDRAGRQWESQARALIDLGGVETLRGVPCCGLKPELACKGSAATRGLIETIFARAEGRTIYTTCASCAGQFARAGYAGGVRHVLGVLVGVDEAPDCTRAVANRARRAFDRALGPLAEGVRKEGA